jgi:ParB family chromosome partitioning protein
MSKDKKKKGLGRGLMSLFGDENNSTEKLISTNTNLLVSISDLTPNRFQPRINFDKEKLKELARSIKNNGLVQPIAVRVDKNHSEKYEIIAGERRWIAAQQAGLHEVPVLVLDINDNQSLEIAIVENIQRENLNIVEEAKAYQRLIIEFSYDNDQIAKMMSKSRSHIINTLRLLTLPDDVILMLEEGQITAGQARPLIGLPNPSQIAEEIIKKKISSRGVESLAQNIKNPNRQKNILDPNIKLAQQNLEESLGLSVEVVNSKKNKGKVIIKYNNLEQFELIENLLKSR